LRRKSLADYRSGDHTCQNLSSRRPFAITGMGAVNVRSGNRQSREDENHFFHTLPFVR
jgi:hypothetical protein